MKPKQKTPTNTIEEAYKMMSGAPAGDAVSVAAKGGMPETDNQQRMRTLAKTDSGAPETGENEPVTHELEEAYAKLFGGLADIFENLVGEPNGEDAGKPSQDNKTQAQTCDCCDQTCDCGDCQSC